MVLCLPGVWESITSLQGIGFPLSAQVWLGVREGRHLSLPLRELLLSFQLSSGAFSREMRIVCSVPFLTGILLLQRTKVAARTPTGCGCSTRKPSCLTACTGDSSRTPARRRPCGSTPAWWGRPAPSGCCCCGAEPAARPPPAALLC